MSGEGVGMTDGNEEPPPGSMRFQDEGTQPREPTLAERKAREQAEKRQAAEAEAKAEEEARGRRKRKRILIGTGATVGVAAIIAAGYGLSQANDDVTARCVDDSGVVVSDSNCVTPAASGTYHSGGGLYPIFIGSGGRQYHYYYGGSGNPGQVAFGGTTSTPRDSTHVTTPSGKTVSSGSSGGSAKSSGGGSVSRGGLGSSSSGSSSGS